MNTGAVETWLCDLGNSRAKLARLVEGRLADTFALDWNRPDFTAAVRARTGAWPRPARVLVASVAPVAEAARVRDLVAARACRDVEWLRSPREACGIHNSYARPERLGIDRFLAMAGVRAHAPGAAIVVGCGTALTLDALAADGRHVLGLITLSPARMLETLRSATAIADSNPDAFAGSRDSGDDTAIALEAGCRASAGALVEWFAARQQAALGKPAVWLHGGWAAQMAQWLAQDGFRADVRENAVLDGLAAWARNSCDHP